MQTPSPPNYNAMLNHKTSSSLQSKITTFIYTDFPSSTTSKPLTSLSQDIQTFISKCISEFCHIWHIKLTYQSESSYQQLCDFFESLIMSKLYNYVYCSTLQEKETDYTFDNLLHQYQFISSDALEIPSHIINPHYLSTAINRLAMINIYKTPKDKMYTFINVVTILSLMYTKYSNKETAPGAEEIFPLLVYTVLKANVPKLKSNLNYYCLFRHASRIENEEDYYLQTFTAVVKFIDNISNEKLVIDKNVYERYISEYVRERKDAMRRYVNPFCKYHEELLLLKSITLNESENANVNVNGVVSKKKMKHVYGIDFDKLYNEYCKCEFKEFSVDKMEEMCVVFQTVLKLIHSYISNNKY